MYQNFSLAVLQVYTILAEIQLDSFNMGLNSFN